MQETGLKRNTIDKFYTNQSGVKFCIDLLKKHLKIGKNDLIVEPSAGNGAFIPSIKKIVKNYKFFDISPEDDEIIKKDFLEVEKFNYPKKHCFGNPPFGRQSSLAIKFIKKACNEYDTISFILPKSFKKDSMKKHFPLYFHLIHQEDMPFNSFLIDGNPYNVETVFQIWEKKDFDREIPDKLEANGYSFVGKEDDPNISLRRVGINAGTISKDIENKSVQSHYFIKFDGEVDEILKKLEEITFEHGNTVGPKSISKQEVIKEFNKYI